MKLNHALEFKFFKYTRFQNLQTKYFAPTIVYAFGNTIL